MLEVGVGTGRWAVPLARRGVAVVGVDLSLPMLERLRAKAGGEAVPLVQGDATALPFGDGAFEAAYVCHVLHLVPAWEQAVQELLRVVARPGVVLADFGGSQAFDALLSRALGESFDRGAGFPGLRDVAQLDETMRELGAAVRVLPGVAQRIDRPLRMVLDRFRGNQFSWTWTMTDEEREAAAARFEAWADDAVGGVDAIPYVDQEIAWHAYDLPG